MNYLGHIITPILESRMEKNMEHEAESRIMYWCVRIRLGPWVWGPIFGVPIPRMRYWGVYFGVSLFMESTKLRWGR